MSNIHYIENEKGFYQSNKKCRECHHTGAVTMESICFHENIGKSIDGDDVFAKIKMDVCPKCGNSTRSVMNFSEIKSKITG